eukprot:Phypoly_transcript_16061.p1 GENE.Phypoly_transcript_16061~~Phypoly_transcript_16061.p1  ORF type:complete len:294 (+),score=66.80 Phypoly_transcript_16061:2-883(+)
MQHIEDTGTAYIFTLEAIKKILDQRKHDPTFPGFHALELYFVVTLTDKQGTTREVSDELHLFYVKSNDYLVNKKLLRDLLELYPKIDLIQREITAINPSACAPIAPPPAPAGPTVSPQKKKKKGATNKTPEVPLNAEILKFTGRLEDLQERVDAIERSLFEETSPESDKCKQTLVYGGKKQKKVEKHLQKLQSQVATIERQIVGLMTDLDENTVYKTLSDDLDQQEQDENSPLLEVRLGSQFANFQKQIDHLENLVEGLKEILREQEEQDEMEEDSESAEEEMESGVVPGTIR